MDRSSLTGLAMLGPIIGLSQGHSNGKTIKTIPQVPLNTNKVLSRHQEPHLSLAVFPEHDWPFCRFKPDNSGVKHAAVRRSCPGWGQKSVAACMGGLIIADVKKTCKLRERKNPATVQKGRLP